MRAHHAENDESKIFDDHLAGRLITRAERVFWETRLATILEASRPGEDLSRLDHRARVSEALRASAAPAMALARARFAEDHLHAAIRKGTAQYVILGAGLDTFALRRAHIQDGLEIFEIDQAATQQSKRARISAAGLSCPPNLHFLSADFERETVLDVLQRCPLYRSEKRTFFSWLGVTYYLSSGAIFEVLRSIGMASAPESGLAFDYIDRDGFDATKASARIRRAMERTRHAGEPMVFGFKPDRLSAELAPCGFRVVETIDSEMQQARYFNDRKDGLKATEHFHLALAEVTNGL